MVTEGHGADVHLGVRAAPRQAFQDLEVVSDDFSLCRPCSSSRALLRGWDSIDTAVEILALGAENKEHLVSSSGFARGVNGGAALLG